jgi:autotransporter-associated beta strand protein
MKLSRISRRFQHSRGLSLFVSAVFLSMAASLPAQTLITWNGGGADTNWTTSTNWVGGVAPVTGNVDALDFGGTTGLTNTNNNTGNFSIANITFDSTAGAFDITSLTSTLVLGASSLITDQSTSLETLNANVNMGSGLIVTVTNSSGELEITGNLSGGHSLTVNGPGTVYLNGGINNYTSSGGTNVNAGTLEVGSITLTTTQPFGATNRPLNLNGGTLSLDGGTGTFSIANSVTSNISSSLIVGNTSTSLNVSFTNTTLGVALGNSTGGSPTLNISLPNSASIVSFNGPLIGGTGTTNAIELGTSNGTFRWNGSGSTSKGGANISFDLGTGSATMNSGATNTGVINLGALSGGPNTVLSGDTKAQFGIGYQIGNNSLNVNTTFSGAITDGTSPSATTGITKIGPTTLTLAGSSSYTGDTNINNGTIELNGVLSATSGVNINSPGTLSGTGSITSTGLILLASGAVLAPGLGLGTGTLTLSNLIWAPGGKLDVGIIDGGTTDIVALGSGTLTAGGTGAYDISFGGATLSDSATYTIISFGSESGFVASDFTATDVSFAPGASGQFNLTTSGPGSLTFTVTGVPEPAVYGLTLGVVALLLGFLRQRKIALRRSVSI